MTSGKTTRTIVWATVALFGVTMAAIVAIVIGAGGRAGIDVVGLVSSLLGSLAAIAAVLVNLRLTAEVRERVETVADDTHKLRNGLLDAKVRSGVAEVLHPSLVDPEYAEGQATADAEATGPLSHTLPREEEDDR